MKADPSSFHFGKRIIQVIGEIPVAGGYLVDNYQYHK